MEVGTQEEQSLLTKFAWQWKDSHSAFWIGLTDKTVEGTWAWDHSGRKADFTMWDTNQPQSKNNDNEELDCTRVLLRTNVDGKWNANECNGNGLSEVPYGAVCELYTGS